MWAMADIRAAVFVIRVKAEVHRHPFRLGEYRSITPHPAPRKPNLATSTGQMD
jgi:hypothetical protein